MGGPTKMCRLALELTQVWLAKERRWSAMRAGAAHPWPGRQRYDYSSRDRDRLLFRRGMRLGVARPVSVPPITQSS